VTLDCRETEDSVGRKPFRGILAAARKSPEFWHEIAVEDFTEEVVDAMERQGVTRAELARRLGTSQAYVTKLLSGNANFTLKTMVKVALCLGRELRLHLAPRGSQTRWLDVWAAQVSPRPAGSLRVPAASSSGRPSQPQWSSVAGLKDWPQFSSVAPEEGPCDDERTLVA
jgi:transcriptional regulator with XRE-family HTH domain